MNFADYDAKKLLLIALFVGLPILSINVERNAEGTPWFLRPFSILTGSAQSGFASFSGGVRGTASLYLNLVGIKVNNRQLTKDNAQLRAQLGEMTELRLENKRLYNLLEFRQKSKMELLGAKVIGRDLVPDHSTITINRGTSHGLKRNMAVITAGGAVGYVVEPEAISSKILLLTDRYTSIGAIVQRSRARGLVEGRNKNSCRLMFLKRGDDVIPGDLIVTSGLDNIFPKGFPIGEVTQVDRGKYSISPTIDIKPAIDLFNLEEVFVILNAHDESYEKDSHPDEGSDKDTTSLKPIDAPSKKKVVPE